MLPVEKRKKSDLIDFFNRLRKFNKAILLLINWELHYKSMEVMYCLS